MILSYLKSFVDLMIEKHIPAGDKTINLLPFSDLWDILVDVLPKLFNPSVHVTVDKQCRTKETSHSDSICLKNQQNMA